MTKNKVLTILAVTVLIWTIFAPFTDVKGDASKDWPAVRHDLQGTSSTSVEPDPKHELLWGRELAFQFEDALVKDNEVYARDFLGTIYSVNLTTGETRWKYTQPIFYHMEGYHDYFVGDQCIYMLYNQTDFSDNYTDILIALHRTDGTESFRVTFKQNEWIGGPLLNSRGLLVVNETTLRIYDQYSGILLETQPLGAKVIDLFQSSDKDLIFFEDQGHVFHAYDLNKKATSWTTTIEPLNGWFYPMIVAGNKVLMSTTWRNLTAFDKTNGNMLWSVGEVDALEITANDKSIITTNYDVLESYNIETGALRWRKDLKLTNYAFISPAAIAGDQVLITLSDKTNGSSTLDGYTNLTSFDLQDGDLLWTYSTFNRSTLFQSPVVVPNIIIFINIKGLYALGDRAKFGLFHQNLAKDTAIFFNGNISARTNKKVGFTAPSVNGIDQGTASYAWNFGDGSTSTIKEPTHVYKKSGTYLATLTIKQGGRTVVIQNHVNVRPVSVLRTPFPVYTVTLGIILIVVILGFVGLSQTEPGMYWMLPFFVVLYSRIKKVEALDHYTRGRIMGYLQANPGEHYNSIREELKIQNGVLAYHLKVLEREGYIRSRRDRILKRFYPSDAKVPEPISVEEQIIGAIRRNPGITQIEIAQKTGLPPSTINRVLHQQEQAGSVVLVRDGRHVRCHLLKEPAQ
jgi:predicted transcriptional regulator/outer membrane protein assembly factor BamB